MNSQELVMLAVALLAFEAVVALVPLARRVAMAYAITDLPKPGKLHRAATPYLGGIAVAIAVIMPLPFLPGWQKEAAAILLGALLVCTAGLVDDIRTLGPSRRLAVEAAAASIAFAGGARVELVSGPVDLVLTVAFLVLLTNSFNLLDNMDGAMGIIGTTTAAALAAGAALQDQTLVGGLAAMVAGACVGFLVYNWHPAKIFLGDAGSLFIGFLLGAIALKLRFVVESPSRIAAVGLLVGPALFDTALVVVSRLRAARPIYVGGTDHTSHRLLMLGMHTRTVAVVLALGTGACAVLGLSVGRGLLPAGPVLAAVVALGGVALLALLRIPVYDRGAGREVPNLAKMSRPLASVVATGSETAVGRPAPLTGERL